MVKKRNLPPLLSFSALLVCIQADFESLRHLKAIGATRCWSTAEVPDCEQSVTMVPVGVPTTPFCRDRRRQSTGRYFTGDR